jgi:hypothetical protein
MLMGSIENSGKLARCVSILSTLCLVSAVSASPFVHVDLNFLNISAMPSLTTGNIATYTGTITMVRGASSVVDGIATGDTNIPGEVAQPVTGVGLTSLAGTIIYSNGVVVPNGSTLSYTMTKGVSTQTYTGAFDSSDDVAGDSNILFSFTGPNGAPEFDDEEDATPSGFNNSSFDGVNFGPELSPTADTDVVISNIPSTNTGSLDMFVYSVPEPAIGLLALIALIPMQSRKQATVSV